MTETTFSRIFVIKGQIEIGLKFERTVTSRFDFFNRDLTTECFKYSGTNPTGRLLFIIDRIKGPMTSKRISMCAGIISVTDVVSFILVTRQFMRRVYRDRFKGVTR